MRPETRIEYEEFLETVSPAVLRFAEGVMVLLIIACGFLFAVPIMVDLHQERIAAVSPRGVVVDVPVLKAFPNPVKSK